MEGSREEERQSQPRPRWIGRHAGFQRKWLWAKWRPCNEGKIHSTQQSVFQVLLKMQPHKPCDLEQNDLLCGYCAPSKLCCCSLALLGEESPGCHLERTQGFHALIESTNCLKKKFKKSVSWWCVNSPASKGMVLWFFRWARPSGTLQHTPSVPAHVWPLVHSGTHR